MTLMLTAAIRPVGEGFAERALVGTALGGVLAVDKAVVFFTVLLVHMGECIFQVFVHDMHDRIKRAAVHVVFQQVFQPVLAFYLVLVVADGQAVVQVGVVPQHGFDVFLDEVVVAEHFRVGAEADPCAVAFGAVGQFFLD